MTIRRVIACGLLIGFAAASPVDALPAPGVQRAVRRFPTLGVLIRQLPDVEVAVAECDMFGEPSDACTEARARDLGPMIGILSLPTRRRRTGAASVTCTTPVVWHGEARRPPSFACEASGDYYEARVTFDCSPRERDGLQYCHLHVTTSGEDEDHVYTWDYSVTGAGASLALGPVVFSYATHN